MGEEEGQKNYLPGGGRAGREGFFVLRGGSTNRKREGISRKKSSLALLSEKEEGEGKLHKGPVEKESDPEF